MSRSRRPRVTVFATDGTDRPVAVADRQRALFPDARTRISGRPGAWKIRREVQDHEAFLYADEIKAARR